MPLSHLRTLTEATSSSMAPRDPLTFAGVTALLIAVAAAGSYVPARRAIASIRS